MPKQPKPKPVGRPKMAKGEAKGKIVPIRFNAEDLKRVAAAAKIANQTVSDWIRGTVSATLLQTLATSNQENGARSPKSRQIRKELRGIEKSN